MAYQATTNKNFTKTVSKWFSFEGEILVLFRFSHAGGSKSWEFFSSYESFLNRLNRLPERTCVIVFKKHEFKIRGIVNQNFIERARTEFSKIKDCLLICEELVTMGSKSWYHENYINTIEELEEELLNEEFCFGKKVSIGSEPKWLENNDNIIDAVIPLKNGVVETGIY